MPNRPVNTAHHPCREPCKGTLIRIVNGAGETTAWECGSCRMRFPFCLRCQNPVTKKPRKERRHTSATSPACSMACANTLAYRRKVGVREAVSENPIPRRTR